MSVSRASDTPPLAVAIDAALRELVNHGALTPQSERRLCAVVRQFQSYAANGLGLPDLNAVRSEHVRSFATARGSDGRPPAVATMHLRRSAVRLLFSTARGIGLTTTDPTVDVVLPPRSSPHRRPLTDEEVALCRSFASHSLAETRRPAAWALAEATARTSEIPHIRASDIDLAHARVWIHGGSKTVDRWGRLTMWGIGQLEERLRLSDANGPFVYQGDGAAESRQASSCAAIAQTLRRAGLALDPDVGPSSVAAWAGARAFMDGASIDEVARLLGIRSLDRAARFIGCRWAAEH